MENPPTPSRKAPAFRRPAIVLNEAEKNSDSSSSDAPDGAFFRQPLAPIQMTISPGNAANDVKLAEKLKKLELSRKKSTRSHPIDLKTPSKVDLVATEKLFVESSVENIPQTPRNRSIREPFRTPAQFTHNVSSMDFPRDSIRSNATYVITTPRIDRALHPHNDPFTPSTPSRRPANVSTPLAYEEKLERQFVALSSWANVILDSASFVSEIDLGTSKQDASRKLQEMLTKTNKKNGMANEGIKGKYTDMCLRKKCLDYLKRADSVYQSITIPGQLKSMVERGEISIKPNIEVYANIGVQTSILSLLFSLHPFWLFIAVETVCAEFNDHDTVSLDARLPFSSSSFAQATVRFIHEHILANAKLMSKKKFAIGTVKKIVTDKGREMLHKHCITCILSMAVLLEYAKNSYLFENTPGLFVKNSEIKTVNDFCTELSRLVLSASGTSLNKAFDKSSFRRSYRQSFLEEYQYVMHSVRDMADGIILGRLIELLTDSSPLSIIGNMRNPQGDRIRKKGNVEKALIAAAEAGIDVDGISIDQILSAHRESCLDLMWRLVGVYVKKRAEQEPLRRESLCLDGATDVEDADDTMMGAPLGGMAESAFTVYQQLAFQFGMNLSKWADLEDGLLLSSIWRHYNPTAPDVRFYDGETLFDKVANAADSDLGIPIALTALRDERQLGLFAHMFLTRLISYKRLRDSEMSDGDSDASSIVSIIRKEGVNLSEETERIQRVRLESERANSTKDEEERLKREEERRREEELRRRFEEEEEERLTTEWRSPSRSEESIEREEKMMMEKGEEERIEEEMRRAEEERMREEEARIEAERVKKMEEERQAEEKRMREEEERRRMEEEEMERLRREREEEDERIRREEEARLEMERLRREEEEMERLRLIEVARVKAEEEERLRRDEEERMRIIEEARLKEEEEERLRMEEEERMRIVEEARLRAEEEERVRREREEEERREKAALTIQCWVRGVFAVRLLNGMKRELEERLRWEEEERMKRDREEESRWRAALFIQNWFRGVLAVKMARRLVEERKERERRRREEEGRRERAALTIQCWIRRVFAFRILYRLWSDREMQREEERRRGEAAMKITSWICDRLAIRAAKKELNERRMRREEEEERLRVEEELRRKNAVATIEKWYYSIRSIRAARFLLNLLREREEQARRLREEAEERKRQEEEARRVCAVMDSSARKIQDYYRGYRLKLEAKEELKRRRERMMQWREEQRLERLRMEEEERARIEEEERMRREEEERLEMERLRREEEEKRLRDEEEARLEMERQLREEEEERLEREEANKIEMERMQKEIERQREEEELREWGLRQQKARENEERIYQEMLAEQERSRRLDEMRENRSARVIQSSVRSWLQKRRMERRTVQLLQSMEENERKTSGRQTISGFSDDHLLAGVREIKRRQRKLSLTLYRITRISNVQAATRIQAWWRGIRIRRDHRVEMELIGLRMKEYNQRADKIMEGDTRERSIPVSKRLANAKVHLKNAQRLYDIKVACYTTMSLCRLSSLYCERAIVLDLHTLLIHCFSVQADRSPPFEEIIEFGVQALEEMVKCTTDRVRSSMVEKGENLVNLASHQMMAFHHNKTIAPSNMRILRMCKEILPVESHDVIFEKMYSYFLKKGEEKFGKLPSKDIRYVEFVELKKTFSK